MRTRTAIADRFDLVEPMTGQQHGHAVGGERPQLEQEFGARDRIEASAGFVENQEFRFGEHRPGQAEADTHAGRVPEHTLIPTSQIESFEQHLGAAQRLGRSKPGHDTEEVEVLAACQSPVQRPFVGEEKPRARV